MPELPEVESLAADLRERVAGRRVDRVDIAAISALKTYDPPPTALHGRVLTGATRHGKFLDVLFERLQPGCSPSGSPSGDDLHLVIHLARAGWLHFRDSLGPTPLRPGKGPVALRVRFDDGSGFDLTEAGTQKKLAAYLVTDPALVPGVSRLGPDALGVDPAGFAEAIRGRRGQLKGVITEQQVISGVGNAYSDEILHRARLSPFAISSSLTDEQMQRLYDATQGVLRDALARSAGHQAASLKAEKKASLVVHNRTGLPCPVCGDLIREVSFATSSLQYCPTCQTGGKPLADRRLSRLVR